LSELAETWRKWRSDAWTNQQGEPTKGLYCGYGGKGEEKKDRSLLVKNGNTTNKKETQNKKQTKPTERG